MCLVLLTNPRGHLYLYRVAPVYGGAAKVDQIKELKNGVEIVVATPVRKTLAEMGVLLTDSDRAV